MRKSHGVVMSGTLQMADISEFYAVNPNTFESEEFLACENLKSTENLRMVVRDLVFYEPLRNEKADFMGLDTVC